MVDSVRETNRDSEMGRDNGEVGETKRSSLGTECHREGKT